MEHYKAGGPAFIMIGGENMEDPAWEKGGQWYKWAAENNAAMFLLEHRFYGQSHPTFDMSIENMKFLSSRQALQDLAHFMTAMNTKHNLTGSWITFGGSYPGSLSAWMNFKFPHLVAGSVSSSAPLYAKLDYHEYFEVIAAALDTTGPGCSLAIKEAIAAVEALMEDKDKWEVLSIIFKLCETLDGFNKMDVSTFMENIIDSIARVDQYDGEKEGIFSICEIMTDKSIGDPIKRLAVLTEFLFGSNGNSNMSARFRFGHFLNSASYNISLFHKELHELVQTLDKIDL